MSDVVRQKLGSVADLHALDPFASGPPANPVVWLCRFDAAAIVLGSRQTPDVLDLAACEAAGLQVAKRRSGGGAVLLRPDAVVWVDLILPIGVAPDDVRGSMVWVGEVWRDALVALGIGAHRLDVHHDGMLCTPWSQLVCFAGVGPGEVLVDGRKFVGLSQRRTRHGIRVQGQLHRRAIVGETGDLFGVATPDVPIIEPATVFEAGIGTRGDDAIASALATAMSNRIRPV